MLNTGLLTPQQIVDAVLNHTTKYNTPLNSLEGFNPLKTYFKDDKKFFP
jgi:deoxyribodipyrimidine photolyase-like uncharacterized protein